MKIYVRWLLRMPMQLLTLLSHINDWAFNRIKWDTHKYWEDWKP